MKYSNDSGKVSDLTGCRFTYLTVLKRTERPKGSTDTSAYWKCRCRCGAPVITSRKRLRKGTTKSCGCLAIEQNHVHGKRRSPEYVVWAGMRQRCTNPKHVSYPIYGGRGIKVCKRWEKFENFYADMGPRPSPKMTIERKNNDGPYSQKNCEWTTRLAQAGNTRRWPKRA